MNGIIASVALPLLVAAGFGLGGCAGVGTGRQAHLPFRVAILPVNVQYTVAPTREVPSDEGLRLDIDPRELGARIAEVLASQVFADAIVLDPSADWSEPAEVGSHDAYWIEEAVRSRANLILECSLRVDPFVESLANDRFWPNLLLFAIGGPACWFVPDRSYRFEARLSAQLHQVDPLRAGLASLADGRARLAFAHAQVQEIDLNLMDRAGDNVLPYVGSILIPAGFLASESDQAAAVANETAAADLAAELGAALGDLQHQIADGGSVTDIVLSEDLDVSITESAVELRGSALLRGRAANRLESYTASIGGHTVEGMFGDGTPDEMLTDGRTPYLRYPLEITLPRIQRETHVELELVGGGRDRPRRTFCIPLAW